VAAPIVFGRLHVLPVIEQLLRRHRDLSIRLTLSDRLAQLVEEGVDVAVRIGTLADSALMAVKVGEVRRVLVASPAYLAARGIPSTPAALARHDLIAFEGIESTNDWRFGAQDRTSVRVEPRLAVNSADAAIAAAEAGLGITRTLSYQAQAGLEAGRLALVLQEVAPAPVPISLVYPARRLGSPNVAAFVNAARAHFRERPVAAFGRGGNPAG
jgi:DNA-binding transcriptional LysR family regulator